MCAFPVIHEAPDELERQMRQECDMLRKQRLHLLVLIQNKEVKSRAEAARHLGVHRNTVARWLGSYQEEGLDAFLHVGAPGRPFGQRLLPPSVFEALLKRLDGEGFASYKEAQQWINETFDLEVGYASLHRMLHYRLGAKLKRSRPRHPKRMRPKPLTS